MRAGLAGHKRLVDCPIHQLQPGDVTEIRHIFGDQGSAHRDRMCRDHAVEVSALGPAALGDNGAVGFGGRSVERQNGYIGEQQVQPGCSYGGVGWIFIQAPLELGETQRGEKYFAIVLDESVLYRNVTVAGMDGDVRIKQIG